MQLALGNMTKSTVGLPPPAGRLLPGTQAATPPGAHIMLGVPSRGVDHAVSAHDLIFLPPAPSGPPPTPTLQLGEVRLRLPIVCLRPWAMHARANICCGLVPLPRSPCPEMGSGSLIPLPGCCPHPRLQKAPVPQAVTQPPTSRLLGSHPIQNAGLDLSPRPDLLRLQSRELT